MDNKGFSLVELIMVIAVIAILASMAFPLYESYFKNSRRTDAQSIMLDIQLTQERYRVNSPAYGTLADLGFMPSSEYYTFAVSGNSATTYTITATAMSGTTQANDTGCTSMSIDQASTRTPADCWKK